MNRKPIDRSYLALVILMALGGFVIFASAAAGLVARSGASFQSVALNQALGLAIGFAMFYVASRINYKLYRRFAFIIFALSVLLNLALFIPHFGVYHGGATRWVNLGPLTFQPSEFLKLAFIAYFSGWLARAKGKTSEFKKGILPFLVLMGVLGVLLLSQSDTNTFAVIFATGLGMLLVSGGKLRHIGVGILAIVVIVALVAAVRPYARERIMTYLHPGSDPQGSGYQLQQSLIAVGSGGPFGRGYGQSVQKFGYLPEPIGDSIFAVAAEEFGFAGAAAIVLLFILFAVKCLRIAARAPDPFGGLMAAGIAMLVTVESFMNIGAALGLIPISGVPLLFVSHGGTALVISLASAGIVANISRQAK